MKGNFLHLLVFVIFFISLSAGCSKNEDSVVMNKAVITGPDLRKCLCCGGFFIEINNSLYRFFDLPKNSKIELKTDPAYYPLNVNVNWKNDENQCLGDEIIINQIELR